MEDGSYRAQRATGGRRRVADEPDDVLARHGLLSAPTQAVPATGGRAARRRAAEEHAAWEAAETVTGSGRHAAGPAAPPPVPDPGRRAPAGGRNGVPAREDPWPPADGPAGVGRRRLPDGPGHQDGVNGRPPQAPHDGTGGPFGSPGRAAAEAPGRSGPVPRSAGPRAGRRRLPEPPDGAPHRPAAPDATTALRTDARPVNGGARRRRAEPVENGLRPADAVPGAPATTALPTPADAPRRRAAAAGPADRPPGRSVDAPGATTALPAAGGRRRAPEPSVRPEVNGQVRPEVNGHPATTAIPGAGGRRARPPAAHEPPEHAVPGGHRRAQPPSAAPEQVESAATAAPAGGGRRRAQPPAAYPPPEHPATARRRRAEPPPGTPEVPEHPATTALPATNGRRRAEPPPGTPEAPEHPATNGHRAQHHPAAPEHPAANGRRRAQPPATPEQPEHAAPGGPAQPPAGAEPPPATTAIPAAGGRRRAQPAATPEPPEAPATTALPAGEPTAARSTSRSRSEGDDRTRALRIDETLTRLTAAHAGLTLAVSDGREEPPPPPRRRIAVSAGRLLAGALAVVVVAATAFGWGTKTWLGSAVGDAAALDPESGAIVDAAVQSGDENVLVVATEPNADTAAPRADTVAIAHIPETGGPVTVLGFPNDLEINRPPCESWDAATGTYGETVPAEPRTRLVSALDVGGPRCLTRVMQQLTGIAITKYVGTDLGAVPAMTEAVGGAEVCVPRPVLDGVLGPVVPDPGTQQLSGVRAADFVQAGEVAGDPSPEYGRIQRQQQVLAAVLDEAVSGTALLDVGRVAALRPALSDAVVVDGAGLDQVLALAMTLRRLDAEGVRYAGVPTADRNNRGNLLLRDTSAAELFEAVRTDAPLPAEATDPGAADAGPTPSDVTVEVFNASDRSGLAGEVGETLSSLGFGVGDVANAEQPTSETVIRFSPDQAAAAELLAATVPSATSVPDPGATGVLHLVLGRSFDDVVRAPSEPIALAAPATPAPEQPAVNCA